MQFCATQVSSNCFHTSDDEADPVDSKQASVSSALGFLFLGLFLCPPNAGASTTHNFLPVLSFQDIGKEISTY